MTERDLDVVLYGATGYTGQLIARALDEQGARFAIAGRSPGKLEALASELETTPATIEASIEDARALDAMAEQAHVVVSAAGPFERLGPPVFEAAIRTGTHFVDITGEQSYLRWAADQDARARKAGITVVNAMGFDVVPSDMAAVLASEDLEPVESVDLFIATNADRSAGTLRTMAGSAGEGYRYEEGRFKRTPPGRYVTTVEFPNELGERTCLFVPWGDVATAPRSTGARTVRTFFSAREDTAQRMHRLWPVTWASSFVPLLGRLLEMRAPDPGEGPSPEEREQSRFTILGVAEDAEGWADRSLVTGRDPYGLTGEAAAKAALAIARGEVEALGVCTPTQAFGVERLEKMLSGFELEARRLA